MNMNINVLDILNVINHYTNMRKRNKVHWYCTINKWTQIKFAIDCRSVNININVECSIGKQRE